jgi:hypothetical protein
MKNKLFIVGLISLMMVAGLFLSCKDKDDGPCCTAADFAAFDAGTKEPPACCLEILGKYTAGLISTEADLGCCRDAAVASGFLD